MPRFLARESRLPAGSANQGLLAIVALLAGVLAVGAFVVVRSARERDRVTPQTVGSTPTTNPTSTSPEPARPTPRTGVAESVEAGIDAANTYIRQSKFAEASAILAKLAERAPMDQAVRVAWAQALLGEKKPEEAYAQYEAALSIMGTPRVSVGSDEAMKLSQSPPAAALHFEAGTCASRAGMLDRAIEHYWMAQVLDNTEARYPLFLGMVQVRTGDEAAATASLLRAAKLKPELAEAWGTLAELALRRNQLGIAQQHVERARKLQPDVTRWRVVEGRIHNRSGKPEQTLTLLGGLSPAARADKSVASLLSETYGLLDRPKDAARVWAELAQSLPNDAEVHYQAALAFHRIGDTKAASEHARIGSMLGSEGAKELLATMPTP